MRLRSLQHRRSQAEQLRRRRDVRFAAGNVKTQTGCASRKAKAPTRSATGTVPQTQRDRQLGVDTKRNGNWKNLMTKNKPGPFWNLLFFGYFIFFSFHTLRAESNLHPHRVKVQFISFQNDGDNEKMIHFLKRFRYGLFSKFDQIQMKIRIGSIVSCSKQAWKKSTKKSEVKLGLWFMWFWCWLRTSLMITYLLCHCLFILLAVIDKDA